MPVRVIIEGVEMTPMDQPPSPTEKPKTDTPSPALMWLLVLLGIGLGVSVTCLALKLFPDLQMSSVAPACIAPAPGIHTAPAPPILTPPDVPPPAAGSAAPKTLDHDPPDAPNAPRRPEDAPLLPAGGKRNQ